MDAFNHRGVRKYLLFIPDTRYAPGILQPLGVEPGVQQGELCVGRGPGVRGRGSMGKGGGRVSSVGVRQGRGREHLG